ncbi:MAG: helix-turn-helix domain-containing protein [Candidatus Dormibacteria bacterium]|jgi:predicted ArsR family transcriptional regulator
MADSTAKERGLLDSIADPPRSDELEKLIAALQDPTRRRILLALVHDGRPHTIDEICRLVDVHRTVAFTHLERLAGLGYVEKSQRRGRLGKPASLYAARVDVLSLTYPARQFVTLATILSGGLTALGDEASAATKAAGVRFGEQLSVPTTSSVADALLPLQSYGADYHVDGDRIVARNCIFHEACDQARAAVCGAQAGILEGALRAAGIQVTVDARGPLPPRGCAYVLVHPKNAAPARR